MRLRDGRRHQRSPELHPLGQLIQRTDFDGGTGSDTGRLLRIHRPGGRNQQVRYEWS